MLCIVEQDLMNEATARELALREFIITFKLYLRTTAHLYTYLQNNSNNISNICTYSKCFKDLSKSKEVYNFIVELYPQ